MRAASPPYDVSITRIMAPAVVPVSAWASAARPGSSPRPGAAWSPAFGAAPSLPPELASMPSNLL
eukprot:15283217-Alexandrium_andersonii.AAC.1